MHINKLLILAELLLIVNTDTIQHKTSVTIFRRRLLIFAYSLFLFPNIGVVARVSTT